MQIHATKTQNPVYLAAAAQPDFRSVIHVIRAAGLEERIANGGPIAVAELDAALSKHHVGTSSRIALKATLGRVGLLK